MKFPFFSKKTVSPDLSFLGVDMHSHLLPGIDDGLKTIEQSVAFIKELQQVGYRKFICTPHILSGVHNNSPETILPVLANLKLALKEANVAVEVHAAAEYMVDDHFEQILANNEPLLMLGDKHLLIEMSYLAQSNNIFEVIFKLQMRNIVPILAHPERYTFYHDDFKAFEAYRDRGVLFQINILSLAGYYGKEVKKQAEKLIDAKMVEFIGTDMHHERHLAATNELISSKSFYDLVKNIPLRNESL